MQSISEILAQELNCKQEYIENVIALLDEGNTIPFIARYRKEQHGAMDDTALRTLETRLQYLRNLAQRREEVKSSIAAQEKLTDELAKAIDEAATLAEVEDLYRPYKPKRRTRATIAKEKGLEPLADAIFAQTLKMDAPEVLAQAYIDPEKGVETIEDALAGASDILAERISDDAEVRKSLRTLMNRRGTARSAAAKDEEDDKTAVYRQYFEFSQPISRLQSHQVLALNRGEREGALKVSLSVDRDEALQCIRRGVVKPGSPAMEFIKSVCDDSYDRLLEPSMERELRTALTDMANEQAIHNFALNLRPLLMQPPVKGAVTMGLDPGYSHGCKVAVVDETGKVLDTTVVYPTFGEKQKQDAIAKLSQLIKKDNVRHLAIGNGTASRETEAMAVEMIHKLGGGVSYMIVNEAGASVYSASKLAAEEFPQYDVNLRSAVSIARRLQDPLAELVKIDPKAIGVGQYQHDMPEKELDAALGGVVEASGELRRGEEAGGAAGHRSQKCRKAGNGQSSRQAPRLRCGKGCGRMRRRRADAAGYRKRACQARPRPARRAARTHSAHRCAGAEGSEARHGAQRNGTQRHRFRRVRRHRRPSGRACAYLAGQQ